MKSFNTLGLRVGAKLAFGAVMLACLAWSALRPGSAPLALASASTALPAPAELPATWDGQPVRPLALSALEQRFAERFPGRITRLTDGRRIVVLRQVRQATRMLHPAADCHRALGYRIAHEHLERIHHAGSTGLQRCFIATRDGIALRVCEFVVDGHGQMFADTSAWYWADLLGQTHAGSLAITVTEPWHGAAPTPARAAQLAQARPAAAEAA